MRCRHFGLCLCLLQFSMRAQCPSHASVIQLVPTAQAGFQVQEFILSPVQFSVPYSRPRYFALAKRSSRFAVAVPPAQQPIRVPPAGLLAATRAGCSGDEALAAAAAAPPCAVRPIRDYLEDDPTASGGAAAPVGAPAASVAAAGGREEASEGFGGGGSEDPLAGLRLPPALLQRHCDVLDVVEPQSRLTNCFTKSYFKYLRVSEPVGGWIA